jgi:hypothetical protein
MRVAPALSATLVAVLTGLIALPAFAESVLLVRPAAPDEVLSEAFNRLRGELALQGFETQVVELEDGANVAQEIAELAQRAGAFAGISLTRRVGAPAAEICIADRVTGKTSLRTLSLSNGRDAPSVLAVRAADLLRSSLRELEPGERPPPEVIGVDRRAPPESVQRFAREPEPRFRLSVGASALGLGEALGPGYGPRLAFDVRVLGPFGVGLSLTGPALGASYESALGSATVRQELALGRVWLALAPSTQLELRPALVAGAYRLDAQGQVAAPLVARSAHVSSFAAGLGLELAYRVTRVLVLGVDLSALGLTPRPIVAVDRARRAVNFPYLSASAGVGVEF